MPLDAELTNATLALTCELIRRPSVTPDDAGCLELIGERLARCGFRLERIDAEARFFIATGTILALAVTAAKRRRHLRQFLA